MISKRARQFFQAAVSRLDVELKSNGFDSDKLSTVCLLLEDVLHITRRNLNGYIALHEPGRKPVQMAEILKYVAVMLFGNSQV